MMKKWFQLTDICQVFHKLYSIFMKLGFGYVTLKCDCKFHERWHSFSPISLHSLAFMNDQGRTHMTNCIHESQYCRSLPLIHCYLAVQGFIDPPRYFSSFGMVWTPVSSQTRCSLGTECSGLSRPECTLQTRT